MTARRWTTVATRTTSQVDERTQGVQEWIRGRAGGSGTDPGDNRRDHREQRKGGQDAAHEGETEPDGHRAGAGFGAPAEIRTYLGREPGQRGRGGRSETRARTQRVGEA